MKRHILLIVGVATAAALISVASWQYSDYRHTKSFSPEGTVAFDYGDLQIKVYYNRPFKKGRVIFGGLVPFDSVWRTGANEATIFESNKSLDFRGKSLPAGKYSLWTIPREDIWTVIFNSEYGQWGINSEGEANRDPAYDVIQVDVQALEQSKEFEQFTIAFEPVGMDAEMILMWNNTLVTVPFSY